MQPCEKRAHFSWTLHAAPLIYALIGGERHDTMDLAQLQRVLGAGRGMIFEAIYSAHWGDVDQLTHGAILQQQCVSQVTGDGGGKLVLGPFCIDILATEPSSAS